MDRCHTMLLGTFLRLPSAVPDALSQLRSSGGGGIQKAAPEHFCWLHLSCCRRSPRALLHSAFPRLHPILWLMAAKSWTLLWNHLPIHTNYAYMLYFSLVLHIQKGLVYFVACICKNTRIFYIMRGTPRQKKAKQFMWELIRYWIFFSFICCTKLVWRKNVRFKAPKMGGKQKYGGGEAACLPPLCLQTVHPSGI